MGSDKDVFDSSGPYHLLSVDWDDDRHQIAIYASLVKGVYILQRDKKRHRHGDNALAPRWWEFFGFRLQDKLYDKDDKSIFGAVYIIDRRCIIAFRGTMKGRELFHDMKLNLSILTNKLSWKSRFESAMEVVEKIVDEFGQDNVFLAGHSLGAAIAMYAGKHMVFDKRILLKSFFFNPPYITSIMLLGHNKFRKMKNVIRQTMVFLKVTGSIIAFTGVEEDKKEEEMFAKLAEWKPNICVHKEDLICSEYQSYFNDMKKMVENGMADIAHIAARISTIHFWRKIMGKKSDIPLHLLPSAKLIIINRAQGILDAHKLYQWWKPNLEFDAQEFSLYDH
ncbi:GDSL esterase/lipase At4g10955-like [Impatiens glandulifera]|uniref:GDSL esterase/lipase At4g10955-like n=1 Tax=Impatiens glandulifera TaxID=253017 RepID=UPI001FB0C812|nr:GDSL esterase/lipase At4g10955-like [Impatiens glandulifera]